MFSLLVLTRISNWKALSKQQRAFVWQRFIHPLATSRSATNAKVLLGLVWVFGAAWLGAFTHFSTTLPVLIAVVYLPSELVESIVVEINKQAITNFIETHRNEIEAKA